MEKAEAEFQRRAARELEQVLSSGGPFPGVREDHFREMLKAVAERISVRGQPVATTTLRAARQATGESKEFAGAVRCLRQLVWKLRIVGRLKAYPDWQLVRTEGRGCKNPCLYMFERADIAYWESGGDLDPIAKSRMASAAQARVNAQMSLQLVGGVNAPTASLSPPQELAADSADKRPDQSSGPEPVNTGQISKQLNGVRTKTVRKRAGSHDFARLHRGTAAHLRSRTERRARGKPLKSSACRNRGTPAVCQSVQPAEHEPSRGHAQRCSLKEQRGRSHKTAGSERAVWTVVLSELLLRAWRPARVGAAVVTLAVAGYCAVLTTVSAVTLLERPLGMPFAHIDTPESPPYQVLFLGREHVLLATER